MSIWLTKKEKDGSKSLISAEIPFILIIFFIGFIASFIGPVFLASPESKFLHLLKLSWFCILCGFAGVIGAKISLFRKGIWQSWGSKLMTSSFRVMYRTG